VLDPPEVDSVGSVATGGVATVSAGAALVVDVSPTSRTVPAAGSEPVGTSVSCDFDAEPQLTNDKNSSAVTLTAIGRPNILLTHISATSSTNVQGFPHFDLLNRLTPAVLYRERRPAQLDATQLWTFCLSPR
jgi:hypothetical protein